MEHKIFHGNISTTDLANALLGHYNRGNYRVQQIGDDENLIIQVATLRNSSSGGQTSIGVSVQKFEDGIMVQIGNQSWMGIAASLGKTAFLAIRNPLSLLNRIDDVAQDIESLSLRDEIWAVIDKTAAAFGVGHELSERLRRYICEYCNTPNPLGEPSCIACGAPLGGVQPMTCKNCGYIVTTNESICPNCKKRL